MASTQDASSAKSAAGPGAFDPAKPTHTLDFESFWMEHASGGEGNGGKSGKSVKRYVYIRFNIISGKFSVLIDKDTNAYVIPVIYNPRTEETIGVWDLHFGVGCCNNFHDESGCPFSLRMQIARA